MKILLSIIFICLFLLIGIGLQMLFYGLGNGKMLDFYTFTTVGYIMQGIYCTLIICVGIFAGIMSGDENIAM